MEYYTATRKEGNLLFVTTCTDPENIMLSAISQRQILHDITYMRDIGHNPKPHIQVSVSRRSQTKYINTRDTKIES